jgi:hypothetical protein
LRLADDDLLGLLDDVVQILAHVQPLQKNCGDHPATFSHQYVVSAARSGGVHALQADTRIGQ